MFVLFNFLKKKKSILEEYQTKTDQSSSLEIYFSSVIVKS